ncbi:hypothetical protein NO989_21395 [Alteromonas sp. DY56-G5]|uniref:hypothetical protein n=1 Tax=Alteromonas sp. DY56-G5 TaxID=2967128 RepID=UPI001446061D|nr:hypothetical protein [Alteromonadaceae bacterium A_SAG1]
MKKETRENTQWITNILTSIGVIVAIFFSFYNTKYKPNEAHLQISESYLNEHRKVVAYNGGQGLCLDFSIHYPDTLKQAYLFANYEETSLTNVEVVCDEQNLCNQSIPRYKFAYLDGSCQEGNCTAFIGTLKPNESVAFIFEDIIDKEVSISCVDQRVFSEN